MALVRGKSIQPSTLEADCIRQIRFGMADTLLGQSFNSEDRGWHWKLHVDTHLPAVVIANTGPHIDSVEDFRYVLNEFLGGWSKSSRNMSAKIGRTPLLIWKTQ